MFQRMGTPAVKQRLAGSDATYKLLILLAAVLWGASFIFQKALVSRFATFQVMTVNFLGGGLALLVVFRREFFANLDRRTVRTGLVIGGAYFMASFLQTTGINFTTPGKSAFIAGCYCVIVPFAGMLAHIGKPEPHNIVAALLCVLGLGIIGADGGLPLNIGDVLSLVSAFFYASVFVLVAKLGDGADVRVLTIWQLLTVGGLSLVATVLLDQPPAPSAFTPEVIGCFAYEALVNACLCNALVNYSVTKVDATSAALLASLESPFGALFSVAVGTDAFTGRLVLGFALVFAAIIVSEAWRGLRGRLVRAIEGAPSPMRQRRARAAAEPSPSAAASGPYRRLVPPLANVRVTFATKRAGRARESSKTRRGDWCPLPEQDGMAGLDGIASELDGFVGSLVDCEETPTPDTRLAG
jgi:drug/metabolite transporter (DMT)-like permease